MNWKFWPGLLLFIMFLAGLQLLCGWLDKTSRFSVPLVLAWGGHPIITRKGMDVLLEKVKRWLGAERRVLADVYCNFPDLNWPWAGRWGGEGGFPDIGYAPDIRREWNVSYYCGWDPISLKAPPAPLTTTGISYYPVTSQYPEWSKDESRYWPMGDFETPRVYFPRIIRAIEEGKFPDGMRFLGVLLHHIQDRGAFMQWMDLHSVTKIKDERLITIAGYQPEILGATMEDAITAIRNRMKGLANYQTTIIDKSRDAVSKGDTETQNGFAKECAENCAKLTADIIYTAADFVNYEPYVPYSSYGQSGDNPPGVNLAGNASFEIDDGTSYPEGWVIVRDDLENLAPIAEWTNSRLHSIFASVVRNGNYSVKLAFTGQGLKWIQRWPFCIHVKPDDRYVVSGFMKTYKATGNNVIRAEFYKDDYQESGHQESASIKGTLEWQRVEFKLTVPRDTYKMRLACCSRENSGAVWFDDVETMRI